MRLAVATLCSHVRSGGRWWAYEPYVREANRWGHMFDGLTLVAPTEGDSVPDFYAPYEPDIDVEVLSFKHLQGRGFDQEKTRVVELPRLALRLLQASRRCDAVCLRAPSNIGLVGLLLGPLLGRRRIARYTGQWSDYPGEAWSYRLQRRLLSSRWWGAPTMVYADSTSGPEWIHPAFNAVLERASLPDEHEPLAQGSPPTLVFVGRLSRAKNVHVLLQALATIDGPWRLEILGDGPQRSALQALCAELELEDRVLFRGATSFEETLRTYRRAQALVLASETEGWPKALVEGMAFGLACIGSRRGLVPHILRERGWLVEPGSRDELARALREVLAPSDDVQRRREAARRWARHYTLDDLDEQIRNLLSSAWDIDLHSELATAEATA